MREAIQNLHGFFDSTTIHGLSYLTNDKSRSTRFIWFMIVLTASIFAGYFLSETLAGYDTKFTSTTVETKSVKHYPFPAVTFYPGDENSEKGFLRAFLNQFQLTRYEGGTLDDWEIFLNSYEWLVGIVTNELFDGIEKFLIADKTFINQKWKIFKNEQCGLVALEKLKDVSMNKELRRAYERNLFKFKGFSSSMKFIKNEISPAIMNKIKENNLTKSEISSSCNNKLHIEKAASILSFLYLFIDHTIPDIGPGDIASKFKTSLNRQDGQKQTALYGDTHNLFTKIFTEMTKGSLPGSVFETPKLFLDPTTIKEEIDVWWTYKMNYESKLGFLNISLETFITYQLLWYSYNHVTDGKYTTYCVFTTKQPCTDISQYSYQNSENSFIIAKYIRKTFFKKGQRDSALLNLHTCN